MSAARLTVRFPPPGFFLMDATLTVRLDGGAIYQGSFKSGFEVSGELWPGSHTLEASIAMGMVQRTRSFAVELAPGQALTAELAYSRLWGNFKKRLKLS